MGYFSVTASGAGVSGNMLPHTGTITFTTRFVETGTGDSDYIYPYIYAIDKNGNEIARAIPANEYGGSWGSGYRFYINTSNELTGSVTVDVGIFRSKFSNYSNLAGLRFDVSPSTHDLESFNFFFLIRACKAPTSVSVESNNVAPGASIKLSWSGASAETENPITGYEVYRATSATGTYSKLTSITSTATSGSVYVTAPNTNGSSYYYKVLTVGTESGYDSEKSSVYATLTCTYSATKAPTSVSLSATTSTGSNVTLSWSGAGAGTNNPITGYTVQRSESSDGSTWGSWADLSTTTETSLSVAPPKTAGNYYRYQVRTNGSLGNSDWKTSSNTLRRSYTACGAPTACAVDSALSLVATTLRWSGATDGYGNPINKYEVQRRSKAPGGSWSAWSAFETTSGTSLSVSPPATAGHYYQYRVRAQGTAGEAYYSGWKESTNTLRKAHKTIPAFTDPTLIVGQTDVKAIHITELQSVMNNILLPFMGVSTVTFTKLERDSDAKHWGAHVQEIKVAIDSTGFSHEAWVTMQDEVTADVIEQLRRIVKSM